MTDLIPVRSLDTAKPIRLTPAQAGGPIHTRSFTGRFRNLRLLGAGLLFLLFFGTAWIDWNGRQAVLWDLENRQFHIFGATFWPQDFILLSAILIIAAFGLFFITVLAGRVWCGYATFEVGATTAFWVLFFTAATYVNAGWLREKVCRDMCPYSRFQSVMFDSDTLVISYDAARGETRGPRRKDADHKAEGLGDCIDCTMCVQVCPTGIDIRDGLQLECIGCGACIDACDSVMDKLGYARGLVRYSSENELAGGKTHWLRPRLIGYAAMLAVMIGAFAWALAERPLISLDVTRDRGLFRENSLGQIENIYSLKIINKTQQGRSYAIALVEPGDFELHGPSTLNLAPGEIRDLPVSVALTATSNGAGPQTIRFEVRDQADSQSHVSTRSTFLAPLR